MRYRKTVETDKQKLAEWIGVDPDHMNKSGADFWLQPKDDGVACFTVEDANGEIFFVRAEQTLRLHIQFAPPSEKRRTVLAIEEFTKWIKEIARQKKCKQLIFESVYNPLIKFLTKRGFRSSKDEQICDL